MSEKEQMAPLKQEEVDEDSEASMEHQQAQTQQIIETGAITTTKGKHVIHCLTIVGQVEGHYILPPQNKTTKYEHVIPQLVAIQESPDIEGLIIILNTVGGDVEAGLAIAELVSGMKKPTVSLVLGGGHSIGVPLAVSARKSFIVPSATMTIHPVRMNGVVLGVPQTLSYFDKMQDRIVRFVEDNSNISGQKFRELMMNTGELVMDVGTVLDGQQAVECGLIDCLGGLSDAIGCLGDMIDEGKKLKDETKPGRQKVTPYRASRQVLMSPRGMIQQQINRDGGGNPSAIQPGRHRVGAGAHRMEGEPLPVEDHGSVCQGGGESSLVNPFGCPSPYADAPRGSSPRQL